MTPVDLARLRAQGDAQLVVDLAHPGDGVDDVLGQALVGPAADRALERDLAVHHAYLDLAGVEIAVLGEPLADVLADPLVGALVALRSAARVRATRPRRILAWRLGAVTHRTVAGHRPRPLTTPPRLAPAVFVPPRAFLGHHAALVGPVHVAPLPGPRQVVAVLGIVRRPSHPGARRHAPATLARVPLVLPAAAFRLLVTEPRAHLVSGTIEKSPVVRAPLARIAATATGRLVVPAVVAFTTIPAALVVTRPFLGKPLLVLVAAPDPLASKSLVHPSLLHRPTFVEECFNAGASDLRRGRASTRSGGATLRSVRRECRLDRCRRAAQREHVGEVLDREVADEPVAIEDDQTSQAVARRSVQRLERRGRGRDDQRIRQRPHDLVDGGALPVRAGDAADIVHTGHAAHDRAVDHGKARDALRPEVSHEVGHRCRLRNRHHLAGHDVANRQLPQGRADRRL